MLCSSWHCRREVLRLKFILRSHEDRSLCMHSQRGAEPVFGVLGWEIWLSRVFLNGQLQLT